MRRADVIFWWMVAMGAVIVATAVIVVYPHIQGGEPGCDVLLDRLVETRADYHESDSSRDMNAWWGAASDYCAECVDPRLCVGDQPR